MRKLYSKISAHLGNLANTNEGVELYEQIPFHDKGLLEQFKKGYFLSYLTDPKTNVFLKALIRLDQEYTKKDSDYIENLKKPPSVPDAFKMEVLNKPAELSEQVPIPDVKPQKKLESRPTKYPSPLAEKVGKKGNLKNAIGKNNRLMAGVPLDNLPENITQRKILVDKILEAADELNTTNAEESFFLEEGTLYVKPEELIRKEELERLMNNAAANLNKWKKRLNEAQQNVKLNPETKATRIQECKNQIAYFDAEHTRLAIELQGIKLELKEVKNGTRKTSRK